MDEVVELERQRESSQETGEKDNINFSGKKYGSVRTPYEPEVEVQLNRDTEFEAPLQIPKESTKPQYCPAVECDCFGFLQQRVKAVEIPNQCLTCGKLIDCVSKTESTS